MRRGLMAAALVLCVMAALVGGKVEAQPGSGRVVRTFFDSLIADDIDGAMALLSADVELQTPEGDAVVGVDAVRAYLAAIPRPIELGTMLPWGGHKYEAHITADGTPLVFLFDGAGGTIIFIQVTYDDGADVSQWSASAPARAHDPAAVHPELVEDGHGMSELWRDHS